MKNSCNVFLIIANEKPLYLKTSSLFKSYSESRKILMLVTEKK